MATLTFPLSKELLDAIHKQAAKDGVSISNAARQQLEMYAHYKRRLTKQERQDRLTAFRKYFRTRGLDLSNGIPNREERNAR